MRAPSATELDAFAAAVRAVAEGERDSGIGTLHERSVHAVLKRFYEPCAHSRERPVGVYCADIVGEDGIIEIQTGSFSRLRDKLAAFLPLCRVRVVYPVAVNRRVFRLDAETGELSAPRRSPKKGRVYDLLPELYSLREFLDHPGLSFTAVLLEADDIRVKTVRRGRQRSERVERLPTALLGFVEAGGGEGYGVLAPPLPDESAFTSADFRRATGLAGIDAGLGLKTLELCGEVFRSGKRGREIVYSRKKEEVELI